MTDNSQGVGFKNIKEPGETFSREGEVVKKALMGFPELESADTSAVVGRTQEQLDQLQREFVKWKKDEMAVRHTEKNRRAGRDGRGTCKRVDRLRATVEGAAAETLRNGPWHPTRD